MPTLCLANSELIARAAAGDASAMDIISTTHRSRLVSYARKIGAGDESEDVAQEALIRAWRSAATYNGKAALSSWLCQITRNIWIDRMRVRRLTTFFNKDDKVGFLTDPRPGSACRGRSAL